MTTELTVEPMQRSNAPRPGRDMQRGSSFFRGFADPMTQFAGLGQSESDPDAMTELEREAGGATTAAMSLAGSALYGAIIGGVSSADAEGAQTGAWASGSLSALISAPFYAANKMPWTALGLGALGLWSGWVTFRRWSLTSQGMTP